MTNFNLHEGVADAGAELLGLDPEQIEPVIGAMIVASRELRPYQATRWTPPDEIADHTQLLSVSEPTAHIVTATTASVPSLGLIVHLDRPRSGPVEVVAIGLVGAETAHDAFDERASCVYYAAYGDDDPGPAWVWIWGSRTLVATPSSSDDGRWQALLIQHLEPVEHRRKLGSPWTAFKEIGMPRGMPDLRRMTIDVPADVAEAGARLLGVSADRMRRIAVGMVAEANRCQLLPGDSLEWAAPVDLFPPGVTLTFLASFAEQLLAAPLGEQDMVALVVQPPLPGEQRVVVTGVIKAQASPAGFVGSEVPMDRYDGTVDGRPDLRP